MPSGALDGVLRRAADPVTLARWQEQVRSARWCSHPVRLSGATDAIDPATGEVVPVFSTEHEPDGVLLKACGGRRETVCATCAAVYRADAYQLVAAGLRGGKGVPDTVAAHPAVFVTLTAPGFGPVHTRRRRPGGGRAAPCRRRQRCPHGNQLACGVRHRDDDQRLGEPLCPDCFDYEAVILWNAAATELWRRTTIYLQRALARAARLPVAAFRQHARLSYTKVVEYQRRGVIHVHAVVRLDGADGPDSQPGVALDVADLVAAVTAAVGAVAVTQSAASGSRPLIARWGTQVDVRPLTLAGLPGGAVAAYIAKYATKSTDGGLGQLDHRLTADDLDRLRLRPHLLRLVRTAWELGERPELAGLRLQQWAHTLGYRGHWLTKSRRYSTTLGALRHARHQWRSTQNGQPPDERPRRKQWQYAGRGYTNQGDAWLAQTAANEHAEARQAARVEATGQTA